MPTREIFTPRGPKELRQRIKEEIAAHGPNCDLNHIDVSYIKDFSGLFMETTFNGDISKWNTRRATNMSEMFLGCPFTGDVSRWDTRKLVTAKFMFQGSAFNGDVSNWNTQSLVCAANMFSDCPFTGDLSKWNTSSLTDVRNMFHRGQFNGSVANWNIQKIVHFEGMFSECPFNGSLSTWNIGPRLTEAYFDYMFFENDNFAGDLSSWIISEPHRFTGALSEHFKGIAPQLSALSSPYTGYSHFFESEQALDHYLDTQPFSKMHCDILCAAAIVPHWFPKEDHAWFRDIGDMAKGLGMNTHALSAYTMEQYMARKGLCVEHEYGTISTDVFETFT